MNRVDTAPEARALAAHLIDRSRPRPVVVVTIPVGALKSFIDPDEIAGEVAGLVDVYLMPTGNVSRAFAAELPELTQVYGGAGRAYPVDGDWLTDPRRCSLLRFAFNATQGATSTRLLVEDAIEMAAAGGVLDTGVISTRPASGRVRGFVSTRALVDLDGGGQCWVVPELNLPGVRHDRMLSRGQRVAGQLDSDRRLDVRAGLVLGEAALTTYRKRDVVLARVESVSDRQLLVSPVPALAITIAAERITTNPRDRLTDLFSPGDVVAARVDSCSPWAVSLCDVDDDEPIRAAPALLAGGPAWLRPVDLLPPPRQTDRAEAVTAAPAPKSPPASGPERPDSGPKAGEAAADVVADASPARLVGATPAMLDPRRKVPTARADTSKPTAAAVSVEASLRRELAAAAIGRERAEAQRDRALAAQRDNTEQDLLSAELVRMEQRVAELEATNTATRKAHRQAVQDRQRAERQAKSLKSQLSDDGVFLDPGDQLRHDVYLEWVRRIPAADKSARPLAKWSTGPRFLASLESMEGIAREKVVSVVVEVLTGLADENPSREMHPLRTGAGGSDAATIRPIDGATCWRASLQVATPGARRLHFWRNAEGIELSRVVVHDDTNP